MRLKDIAVILLLILIVVMMMIPLPTLLQDILLLANISLSLTILIVAINTKRPLEFSIFPSLLLITTLLRLSLNVSTTRTILTGGHSGKVIEAFGSFVVGGNAVVGFIIFAILMVINFIVITKGSERVAEVAARFTLDAMPGKQMSIDADLNSGMITEQEARSRRKTIEREADFYGAMDGASKFVKGDAIAGILIFIINIIGGFGIGIGQLEMEFTDAASTFTLLSVGDGLVSSIPALILSTATGIIVTRAGSEGNFGDDLVEQLLSHPKLLYIVAGSIAFLGFTPIGIFTTWPIAGIIAFGAYKINQTVELKRSQIEQAEREKENQEMPDFSNQESIQSLLQVDRIEFEFGYGLIPYADKSQGGELLDRVVSIRKQCALKLGIMLPVIRIRDNIQLRPNQYVIKIKGNPIAQYEVFPDHYLALVNYGIEDTNIMGIETIEPINGLPGIWVNEDMKDEAEYEGYTVVDPQNVMVTHLIEIINRYAHEILGREETKQLIDNLKESYPSVVEEVYKNMSIGDIQKILQKLLKEKISIRNLPTILETLADYSPHLRGNNDLLVEYVRQSLSRQITNQYIQEGDSLKVVTLGPNLEKIIMENIQQTENGTFLSIDPDTSELIFTKLQEKMSELSHKGQQMIILCSPRIRMYFRQLTETLDIPVLSYNELENTIEIETIGVVNI